MEVVVVIAGGALCNIFTSDSTVTRNIMQAALSTSNQSDGTDSGTQLPLGCYGY